MREGVASRTARSVAAHRLVFDRLRTPYGDPAADEALTRDVAAGLERPAGTRMHDYLRARTAFFDGVVVNSVEAGVRQVVTGAAGYDGRAFRYARRGVRWFEIDHPATQADKMERITRLRLDTRHIRFIAADFAADPVAGLLAGAGLAPDRPALFLLEGVAVYLEQPVLERVLAAFREVTVDGSPLAISVSVPSARPQARDRFRAAVAAAGEPVRCEYSPQTAGELLARTGWEPSEGRDRLRSAGLLLARAASSPRHPERTRPSAQPSPSSPAVASPSPVTSRLPLSALLSQALVGYTIEFDNQAEHRLPHRTQDHGRSPGAATDAPWLTSLVMWANCLRHGTPRSIRVSDSVCTSGTVRRSLAAGHPRVAA